MGEHSGCHRWMFFFTLLSLPLLPARAAGRTMKYETYEEDAPGTVIGNLAKDMSLSPSMGSKTNFRMMKQVNASFVRLRESDGQLTIGEKIDRERICKHSPQCIIAFDVVSFTKDQFKLIHVEVEVKDINDNAPEFHRKESSLEISENTVPGTRIPLDVAVDEDVGTNYIQSYQISVNSHFTIDVLSRADGVKYAELVLMKELDRETQSSYALELVATDGGNPPRSGITKINVKVKDYNDNSPIFERNHFSVEIPEDAPVGFLLLDLNAVDPDEGLNGEVVYGLGNQVPSEIRQLFRVDRKTGRITLESPMDYESKTTYEFDVQASDLGQSPSPPAICKVVVQVQDVNDNAPEITITPMTSMAAGVAHVTEAAAKDTFVALISASDRDSGVNGQVHCTLYGHDHFRLQQAYEDSYMIVTTAPLDREKIAEYNLTVVAEDLGSPPFRTITQYTVRLTDENDNAPIFSKAAYEVSLVENNAPGAYITTIVARDSDTGQNSKVTYKLAETYVMGSPVSTFVSLDPASGSLYALRSFNYEVLKHLELRVHASDGGAPQLHGTATINLKIVDQNDNAPVIVHPVLTNGSVDILLPKDAPSGYVTTQIKARDADEGINAELSYQMTSSESSALSINKVSGEIYLNREGVYEVGETFKATVTVSDHGRPSLTTTATIRFTVVAGAPKGDRNLFRNAGNNDEVHEWDLSVVIIVVLAGSCTLLLLAIILIATTCNKRKIDKRHDGFGDDKEDEVNLDVEKNNSDPLIPVHSENVFDVQPYTNQPAFTGSVQVANDECCTSEDGIDAAYETEDKNHEAKLDGYLTLPGYGKEAVRPITIWKGNSYTTISARDPQFSGKDSGKGDSDFNDSDSDISGDGLKKDGHQNITQDALWACTSECRILGHSDRCWSPNATRMNTNSRQHLSTFAKTGSLPRDTLRRDNYYQANIPKTVGLQSVYERVLHQEYVIVPPPQQSRVQDINDITIPVYSPTTARCTTNEV
ncbi:Protocadherin-8 [Bagarius yarrelli]|uniref:Protocadherin-8 n=1 Tax=Bagarius yarrelli TaxID=175774 RepID=A0A556TKH4_BAGYA|nr:Protocadherin-8 [Bagarius yarrelli]